MKLSDVVSFIQKVTMELSDITLELKISWNPLMVRKL